MARITGTLEVLREAGSQFFADRCPRLAAAIAYYTLLSLAPFLFLAVTLTALAFGTEEARAAMVAKIEGSVGPEAGELVAEALDALGESRPGLFGAILGGILLLVAATTVFGELQSSLNQVWGLQAPKGKPWLRIIRERLFSLAIVLCVGVLFAASMLANAVLSAVATATPDGGAWRLAYGIGDLVVSFVVLTLLIAAVYKILPDASIGWQDVWSGAAITSALLGVGKLLISMYLGAVAPGSAYGAAGALALLLVWVYFSGLVFFFGAEVTEIRASRRGHVKPRRGATRVTSRRVPRDSPSSPAALPKTG